MLFVNLNASMNLHQNALADAMYKLLGDKFVFIEFGKPEFQYASYKGADEGLDYYQNRPYILSMYKSADNEKLAKKLIEEADVMRVGGEPTELTRNRIRNGKLTFRSSERLFKKNFLLHKPSTFIILRNRFVTHSNANYRLLCQSAYLPNDLIFGGNYNNKCYKFAYFAQVEILDIDKSLSERRSDKLQIIWCARFIDWKHPELPIILAKLLIASGRPNFEIKMIGADTTPLWKKTQDAIIRDNLQQHVDLKGGMPNAEVIFAMQQSNVFLFTSDKNEGWGVVLNEAMSAGCACVASNEIGSVPYLIKNDINGLIFKSKSSESLFKQVARLYDDRSFCEELGRNAYTTITTEWSAETAAKRLIKLSESILEGREEIFTDGPCSKALPTDASLLM